MKLYQKVLIDYWGRRQDNFDWRTYQVPLHLEEIENFCLLHLNEKVGDAIVNSGLVDALSKARLDLPILVLTTAQFEEYWRAHPNVAEVIVAPPKQRASFKTFRRILEFRRAVLPWRGKLDCVISYESYPTPEHFALLDALSPRIVIGFNKHGFALFDYSLEEGRHGVQINPVATRTATVMRVFDREIDCDSIRFHAPYGMDDEKRADAILDALPSDGARLLLHVYGAGKEKLMNPATAAMAARILREEGHRGTILVSVPRGGSAPYQRAFEEEGIVDFTVIGPMEGVFGLNALVSKMDLVVAPDTAVGHIAAAYGKAQICVFPRRINVPVAWRPFNARCVHVLSTTGRSVDHLDWSEFAESARRALTEFPSGALVR